MNPTIPLVLVFQTSIPLGTRDRHALERFSARWSVEFSPIRALEVDAPPDSAPAYPPPDRLVLQIEEFLNAARLAVARLDEVESRAALKAAERLLTEHPELPQAAWLRAEELTIAADLEITAGSRAELRRRAVALEGPRVLPFEGGTAAPVTVPSGMPVSVELSGLGPRDALEWDGVRVIPPLSTLPGEHSARVLRRGWLVWAAWVSITEEARTVALNVSPIEPCSAEDLAGTEALSSTPRPEPGVACPQWAVARRQVGELEVALCRHSECGRFHRLGAETKSPPRSAVAQANPGGFPAWATVAVATASAALATSLVLWQTGAFDSQSAARERWVYRGLAPE